MPALVAFLMRCLGWLRDHGSRSRRGEHVLVSGGWLEVMCVEVVFGNSSRCKYTEVWMEPNGHRGDVAKDLYKKSIAK
jgi:hypothetical protein